MTEIITEAKSQALTHHKVWQKMINLALDIGTTAAPESYLFYFLAPLSVVAALGMLLVKKAVHSALLLAWVMISLAIFYIAQDALFLGIVQIVVYTGAVMMLFLFILMLVGVDTSDSLEENIPGLRPVSIVAAIGFGGLLVSLIGRATFGRPIYGLSAANAEGNAFGIAEQLFTKYVFAFEVVSALLITAALGAMVLGHSQKSKSKFAQRDLSIARFRKDNLNDAAGLPAAGVYALHNAVDVPALLPTGKAAPTSISNVLQARGDMIESATFQMKSEEEEEK
jgi:NADH-quinone oxidoreductase subunit J